MYILWVMLVAAGFALAFIISQKAGIKIALTRPVIAGGLGLLALMLFIINAVTYRGPAPRQTTTTRADTAKVAYTNAVIWPLVNGGKGYAIVVPQYTTNADLVALGDELKTQHIAEPTVTVMVFTNKDAADLTNTMPGAKINDHMTPTQATFYNQHFVAQYQKDSAKQIDNYQILR